MAEKRANFILNYIRQKEEVTLRELCMLFPDYNEMTIRRDLNLLVKNGYITRTHGGARLNHDNIGESHFYHMRENAMTLEKNIIAQKASQIISGSTIYLDSSTTILTFAKTIPDKQLFIVTNSPLITLEMQNKKNIEVLLTGGSLNKKMLSVSGPVALNALSQLNIDMAFMSASGMSINHGFTNGVHAECEVKRAAINNAKKICMMIDSSKYERILPYTFCTWDKIDYLIADKELPESYNEVISKNKITVL